jgi:Fe-S cluster biogenesis protein NfuA
VTAAYASLEELAARHQLTARDLDVIMVAAGYLSYDLVAEFLRHKGARRARLPVVPPASVPELDVPGLAREIVDRICGCQYHDGGRTSLASAAHDHVHLRVEGACVHCPQIRYTMGILEGALRFRAPHLQSVVIDGTQFEAKTEVPVNSQLTLGMLMNQTGMTFADMDEVLRRNGRLVDDDLLGLARRRVSERRGEPRCEPE